jgi:hypothetical protein
MRFTVTEFANESNQPTRKTAASRVMAIFLGISDSIWTPRDRNSGKEWQADISQTAGSSKPANRWSTQRFELTTSEPIQTRYHATSRSISHRNGAPPILLRGGLNSTFSAQSRPGVTDLLKTIFWLGLDLKGGDLTRPLGATAADSVGSPVHSLSTFKSCCKRRPFPRVAE